MSVNDRDKSEAIEMRTDEETDLAIERLRLDYCEKLYAIESERKEQLEKKARFYLTILTLIIGLLSLKGGLVESTRSSLISSKEKLWLVIVINIEIICLGLSILIFSFIILQVMSQRTYRRPRPHNLVTSLYEPGSKKTDDRSQAELLWEIGTNYAVAVEINAESNGRKAVWMDRAFYGSLATIISLVVLVFTLFFLTN